MLLGESSGSNADDEGDDQNGERDGHQDQVNQKASGSGRCNADHGGCPGARELDGGLLFVQGAGAQRDDDGSDQQEGKGGKDHVVVSLSLRRACSPPDKIDLQAERMVFPLHFGCVCRTTVGEA